MSWKAFTWPRARRNEVVAIVRSTASIMSEVISFRLDPNNPREAQALEVLRARREEGYSTRHVLTEALLGFEGRSDLYTISSPEEFRSTLEQVARLLEQIGENQGRGSRFQRHESPSCLERKFSEQRKTGCQAGDETGVNILLFPLRFTEIEVFNLC